MTAAIDESDELQRWLLADFDDVAGRLRDQVLALVPAERRHERAGEGNSIVWSCLHIAYHAELGLAVLGVPEHAAGRLRAELDPRTGRGGGLQEAQLEWASQLDPGHVDAYVDRVLRATRAFLETAFRAALRVTPDASAVLSDAGVPQDEFAWLYRMWGAEPPEFFVRWPLLNHITSHVGEMLSNRSRMGLNPF